MEWCLVKHRDNFTFPCSDISVTECACYELDGLGFMPVRDIGIFFFAIPS